MKTGVLVLRYSETSAPESGTVGAHEEIVKSHGYVWLGKWGKAIPAARLTQLAAEIDSGGQAKLILAKRTPWRLVLHECLVTAVCEQLSPDELLRVPQYYRGKTRSIGVWFRVISFRKMDKDEASRLVLLSNGRPLLAAIGHSKCSTFWVDA